MAKYIRINGKKYDKFILGLPAESIFINEFDHYIDTDYIPDINDYLEELTNMGIKYELVDEIPSDAVSLINVFNTLDEHAPPAEFLEEITTKEENNLDLFIETYKKAYRLLGINDDKNIALILYNKFNDREFQLYVFKLVDLNTRKVKYIVSKYDSIEGKVLSITIGDDYIDTLLINDIDKK